LSRRSLTVGIPFIVTLSHGIRREFDMHGNLKMTIAIVGSFTLGAGAIQALHAQAKPPAFVVAEVAVKDKAGFEENFLKPTMKDIADHGGKYLAGGYNKTVSLSGAEPPNRVVIVQFANMDAVKEWLRSRSGAIRAPWPWRTPSGTSTPRFASTPWKV
jgi:uncharacterized protein (DUF1330 family)